MKPVNHVGGSMVRSAAFGTAIVVGAVACGDTTGPPDPQPVIQVIVTSPIGTLLAAAWSTDFDAAVTVDGEPQSGGVTWSSSDASLATVSPSGRVTGIAPGAVTITAAARGASGSIGIEVVDVDLAGATAVLEDEYFEAAIDGLSPGTSTTISATIEECIAARNQGRVVDSRVCLTTARSQLTAPANADETVLLAVLDLMIEDAGRLLGL